MFSILVIYVFSRLFGVNCDTVSSPHIRILDVATKSSETRLIPHRLDYPPNAFHPKYQQLNWYEPNRRPLKSYVIYDDYPVKIFKEWKGDADFTLSRPPFLLEFNRHPDAELTPDYYLRNRPQVLPPPKPTLAYHSVYSNVIKVFDDSLQDFDQNRFQSDRLPKPYDGGGDWKSFQHPGEYEPVYPQEIPRAPYQDEKLPENFPKIFSPNSNFHFTPFNEEEPKPPKPFYPQRGYYDTHTVNYNEGSNRRPEDAEFLPEGETNDKNQKVFLCSFIRLNQKQFPEGGGPCSRSDDNLPILAPDYPDYSKLPNDKIPVEHRRQHYQMKRIKRSEYTESRKSRQKRATGFGYGYGTWGSPLSYEGSYDGYLSDYYPSRGGYGNFGSNYGSSYYRNGNRDRYQGYRNKYRSNYDDYDEEYQSNDDSSSRGLSSYLTSGGRRYKNRKNNDDDDNEDEDNDNNHDDDSDEEMERQNSGRRGSNDRRNNDDSRDRRRNNSNSNYDDDDSRDNRRNNNRQYGNSRKNNKRYNDRYDYNSRNNRNNYGNSGYGFSNGYGGSSGGYGNSYGSSGGYGGNGYGNSYGSHGGFGYGSGYGNGFSSI